MLFLSNLKSVLVALSVMAVATSFAAAAPREVKPDDLTSHAVAYPENDDAPFDFMVRMEHGDKMAKAQRYKEALADYCSCFDQGISATSYLGVRVSFLLAKIDALAKNYPPAREAIPIRYEQAKTEVLGGNAGFRPTQDFVELARHLKLEAELIPPFDKVRARQVRASKELNSLVLNMLGDLVEARRYADTLDALGMNILTFADKQVRGIETQKEAAKRMTE